MGKDDGVYVFRPADGQCGTRHFDDGDGEVRQHAERQQDFQRQHRTEGSGKRFAQYRKIAVAAITMPLANSSPTTNGITLTAR